MKIVILDGYAANPGDLDYHLLEQLGEVVVYPRTSDEEKVERAKDADIILLNKVQMDAETLAQLPNLKYIGIQATGFNVVDIAAAKKQGIIVTNIPAYSTDSVAQMTFALILAVTNRVEHYTQENRNERWACRQKTWHYGIGQHRHEGCKYRPSVRYGRLRLHQQELLRPSGMDSKGQQGWTACHQ